MNRTANGWSVSVWALVGALSALSSGPLAVEAAQTISIDSAQITFISPTQSDFDAGKLERLSANTLTVESDVDWKITVSGTSAQWSCSGAKCWTSKPRADIQWRETGGSYAALTGSTAVIKTGAATSPGTEDVVIDYEVLLDWTTDSPGTYTYDYVKYEISAL